MRHSIRRLIKDWRFASAAVVILGLGIGANTAIFSLVNTVLFREKKFADPSRLVDIYQNDRSGSPVAASYPAYRDMALYTDVFAEIAAVRIPDGIRYQDGGVIRTAIAEHTTANYLSVLGLQPSIGRWFEANEDVPGAPIVAVLGHQAWTRKFGADPSIIGRTIRIAGTPVTIIGVGPVDHNSTIDVGLVTDFWLPISSIQNLGGSPRELERRPDELTFFVKARLRDGVTISQAQAVMDSLGARVAAEFPTEDSGRGITVIPSSKVRIHPQIDALLAPFALVLLAVVGLVLAIACSNLATLLLVRATARAKEMSIRLAIGATRGQLVRHMLTESLLLAVAGGVAGCILAYWGIQALRLVDLPIVIDLTVDYRVLTFAVALSLGTGVAFGLAPALKATKNDLLAALRDGESRSPENWLSPKNALVVFQVAVSVLLLAGMSFFLQIAIGARTQDVRFAIDGVAMIETDARYAGYSPQQAQSVYDDLQRRIAAIPGVQSAVLTRGLPMAVASIPIVVEGATTSATGGAPVVAGSIWAGPGFFKTLQIPLLYGRDFDVRDRLGAPQVAVINETMARQYFGMVNAVGRRFRFQQDSSSWIEVVGVVRDTGTADLTGDFVDPTPQLFYRSSMQSNSPPTTVVARTSLDASELAGAMQRALRSVDVTLPVVSAKTMAQYLEDSLFGPKVVATFLGVLGVLGISLAGIGLYAVIGFTVSRRSREIGIRMALGAQSRQVVWAIGREVAMLVGIGTGVGLILSMMSSLALRQVNISTTGTSLARLTANPVALLWIVVFVAIIGLAAAFAPARRAARMDPLSALRHD